MEQTIMQGSRRAGWSEGEANLLWETADEAQQQGLPLKSVFEHIAHETGRRPNSIRNYYYAQVQKRVGDEARPARFVPFTEDEVHTLMEQVLRATAQGYSVRSCLQRISSGDHSLMLRFQNKYRSVIKSRPEMVGQLVEKLRAEGVDICAPEVNHRPRITLVQACGHLNESARTSDDPELVRACETLTKLMQSVGDTQKDNRAGTGVRLDLYRMALDEKQKTIDQLSVSAQDLITAIKEFLGQSEQLREKQLGAFCASISERIGLMEQRLEEIH